MTRGCVFQPKIYSLSLFYILYIQKNMRKFDSDRLCCQFVSEVTEPSQHRLARCWRMPVEKPADRVFRHCHRGGRGGGNVDARPTKSPSRQRRHIDIIIIWKGMNSNVLFAINCHVVACRHFCSVFRMRQVSACSRLNANKSFIRFPRCQIRRFHGIFTGCALGGVKRIRATNIYIHSLKHSDIS